MTARASDTVELAEMAERVGRSLSTLYKTWRTRVADNKLPPTLTPDAPTWSRHITEQFFLGALPPRTQEPRGGDKRQPGRPAAAAPPPKSTFPLMRSG